MAIMINCATDWTYDEFVEDCKLYPAGDNGSDNYRAYFIGWLKGAAEKFKTEWSENHKGLYDKIDGWVGDAFAESLNGWFSDFYKDAYGQRPHLPRWFYVHQLGLPMLEDVPRTFCSDPVGEAAKWAKRCRENG